MRIKKMLKDSEYTTPAKQIAEIIGSPLNDIYLGSPINPCPGEDLTIWPWEDKDGNTGYLRDDAGGWSSITLGGSRDDEYQLAGWWTDFDIRLLPNLPVESLKLALADTEEMGFFRVGGEKK